MSTVLVTGASGHLGAALCLRLAARGTPVRAAVRDVSRVPSVLDRVPLASLDLRSDIQCRAAVAGASTIIHLAGTNAVDSRQNPCLAQEVTGVGTTRLVEMAAAAGVRRIIYVSTLHVYGQPLSGHLSEEMPCRPATAYAISRRTGEDAVLAAHSQRRIEGVVLRLSNVVGPPAHPHVGTWAFLVNHLCRSAIVSQEIALRSDGTAWCNLISRSDALRALEHMLDLEGKHLGGGLFNLAGLVNYRVGDIAHRVADAEEAMLGQRPKVTMAPPTGSIPPEFSVCVEQLRHTGFVHEQDIDKEIRETLLACRRWHQEGAFSRQGAG